LAQALAIPIFKTNKAKTMMHSREEARRREINGGMDVGMARV